MTVGNTAVLFAALLLAAAASGCAGAESLELELQQGLLPDAGDVPVDRQEVEPEDSNCEDAGASCEAGTGACRRAGTYVCAQGRLECDAAPGPSTDEVCATDRDEDCDGAVDEAPNGGCCATDDCGPDEICDFAPDDGPGSGQCVAAMPSDPDDDPILDEDEPANPGPDKPPEPRCGNGVIDQTLGETCDTASPGTSTFECSPTCQRRSLYGMCKNPVAGFKASPECNNNDPGQACVLLSARSMCLPVLNTDGACPGVVGYKQAQAAGLCVISCRSAGDCPAHLPMCEVTPVTNDPEVGTCLPAP